jgi:tRNA (adenine-N(1)-)-methyltransferase non-catalytic subunit
MQAKEVISEGDSLVVRSYDDKCSYILQVNGEKKINKSRVSLKEIVGQPYGAVFELNNRKFQRVSEAVQAEVELYDAEDYGEPQEPSTDGSMRGDNSTFVDTNTAQKLTNEDINKMKESGTSAQEIIKSLIQNSDTFAAKTDYAQAKWIKKKENKYRRRYKILRCTPMSICEASFDKNREKICSMRFESLAQVLSQSGVHSGMTAGTLSITEPLSNKLRCTDVLQAHVYW